MAIGVRDVEMDRGRYIRRMLYHFHKIVMLLRLDIDNEPFLQYRDVGELLPVGGVESRLAVARYW